MSLLNPNKLRSEVEAREARKLKNYEHLLEMCYNKILITNKQSDACCCIFMCPSVVFGLPLFNLYDCIRFIMEKLVEKGFEVHLAMPNNIFISWKAESNPEYSKKIYQLDNKSNTKQATKPNTLSLPYYNDTSTLSEPKLFSSRTPPNKPKTYRPINDYKQSSGNIYNTDVIDIFQSKLDELLS